MNRQPTHPCGFGKLLITLLGVIQAAPAAATSFKTIETLPPATQPLPGNLTQGLSGLAADAQGRLYGASVGGGAFSLGFVFRLKPGALKSDPWTLETLHDFDMTDGAEPRGSLTIGPSGEVYGTTEAGGAAGFGTAFRMDNTSGWPVTILHSFGSTKQPEGILPSGSLVFGPSGLLYGTTFGSLGRKYSGSAFSLSPLGDHVSYTVLHNFSSTSGQDGGYFPTANLIAAPNGELYGTTTDGGLTTESRGVFFKLSLSQAGFWHYTILHDFLVTGDDSPSSVARASNGSYYGCGGYGYGSDDLVYALTPPSGASPGWTESTAATFPARPSGTISQCSNVTVEPSGNLLATVRTFSPNQLGGKILQLAPPAEEGATWPQTTIHTFQPVFRIGSNGPNGTLLREGGLYYGVTLPTSDSNGYVTGGSIYKIRP